MTHFDVNWLTSERGRRFALSSRKLRLQMGRKVEDDNDRIFYANQNCPVLYVALPNGERTYVLKVQPLNSEWPEHRLILTPQQVQQYLDEM